MSHLKTLGSVVVLVLALGIPVAAGETSSPPCAAPGQIDTPPCASAPASSADEVLPETPSLSDSVDIYTLAEIALERLLLF
jgi:hypothetical protein